MKKRKPTAIIGCEYSGRLRDALVKHGWDAIPCDILPSEGDPKNKHHQGDLQEFLSNNHHFNYDLGIFFPSCQHLCGAGAKFWKQKRESGVQQEAIAFVEMIWDSPSVDRIVIENPVGCLPKRSKLGAASQIVHPYYFTESEDDMYQKRTCLWVKGDLPLLTPTNKVDISNLPDSKRHKIWHMSPSPDRSKKRSLTPQGLANAMAAQYTEACRHLFN